MTQGGEHAPPGIYIFVYLNLYIYYILYFRLSQIASGALSGTYLRMTRSNLTVFGCILRYSSLLLYLRKCTISNNDHSIDYADRSLDWC